MKNLCEIRIEYLCGARTQAGMGDCEWFEAGKTPFCVHIRSLGGAWQCTSGPAREAQEVEKQSAEAESK